MAKSSKKSPARSKAAPKKPSKPARKPAPKAAKPKPAKKSSVAAKKKTVAPAKLKKAAPKKPSKPAQAKKPAKPAKSAAKPVKKVSKPAKPAAKPAKASKAPKPAVKVQSVPKTITNGKLPAIKLTPFLTKQRERLLMLKDTLLDSMNGVAKDSLRSRAEGSEASAFGMHQADAGSDAYDRDFALSLLSQEQDSLYEIDQALKRIELGSYGVCEMSGKAIPHARLEALPFTRYTVECQADLEKRNRFSRVRQPVISLFGLGDEDGGDGDDDESSNETKD